MRGRSLEIGAWERRSESLVRTSASRADNPGPNPGGRTNPARPPPSFGPPKRSIAPINTFLITLDVLSLACSAVSTISLSRYRQVDFLYPMMLRAPIWSHARRAIQCPLRSRPMRWRSGYAQMCMIWKSSGLIGGSFSAHLEQLREFSYCKRDQHLIFIQSAMITQRIDLFSFSMFIPNCTVVIG